MKQPSSRLSSPQPRKAAVIKAARRIIIKIVVIGVLIIVAWYILFSLTALNNIP